MNWAEFLHADYDTIIFGLFKMPVYCSCTYQILAVAGRILWNRVCPSFHLAICLGVFLELENKTVTCPNFWKLRFFWKTSLNNFKILLKNLYFLTVKNKQPTDHVVKMLCPKVDIVEHGKLYCAQTKGP